MMATPRNAGDPDAAADHMARVACGPGPASKNPARCSTRRQRCRNATGFDHTILEAVLPDSRGTARAGVRQLDPVCAVRRGRPLEVTKPVLGGATLVRRGSGQ